MKFSNSEIDVLKAIFFLDSPTRYEIVRRTGLSLVSVGSAIDRLVESGMVSIAGKTSSKGGRPSILYRLVEGLGGAIGIFVGIDRCHLVAINANRQILDERRFYLDIPASPGNYLNDLLDQVSSQVRQFMKGERLQMVFAPGKSLEGMISPGQSLFGRHGFVVGVAVPGMVDTERGVWLHGLQVSGIEHVDLASKFGAAIGSPALIEDPARCIAYLAASRLGRLAAGNLVLLYLGEGVGAGIVIDGVLYRGSHGLAGEVGHLVVDPGGIRCACGNVGCLETVLSLPSILRLFQQRLAEGVISSLQQVGSQNLTIEHIRESASAGDRLALRTLFELGGLLGEACARIIQLYNPQTLLVGGPAGILGDFFQEAAWQKIRLQVFPEMLVDLKLEFIASLPGDEALGSALIAQRWAWERIDKLNL